MPQPLLLQQSFFFFLLWQAVFLWSNWKNADDSRAELLTVTAERQHTHKHGGRDVRTGMWGQGWQKSWEAVKMSRIWLEGKKKKKKMRKSGGRKKIARWRQKRRGGGRGEGRWWWRRTERMLTSPELISVTQRHHTHSREKCWVWREDRVWGDEGGCKWQGRKKRRKREASE